ncbi:FadR/GntR family transcriptional regulator [Thermanaeromonas sp. C210]|uniref:FadR/GntR family transcriptional regulator n=1 Tax=Thermanaeromonas sp. C210 TaxID=2731925 RepID=UPI00155D004D|nr:FadR/GntR family transcriptional regulator [Thermanaeromonas sp. C210]GFN24297.1 GntR family transcriptional regulator [Thermanaeromonas sp. C210]
MIGGIRRKLTDEVAEYIIQKIKEGSYKVGDKLPTELILARELGVSRGTLREAINKLSSMGILDVRQGEGTFVKETSVSSIMDSLKRLLNIDYGTLQDLLTARLFIEKGLVSLAAGRAKAGDIASLRTILTAMDEAVANKNALEFSRLDEQFHFELARIAKNKVLEKVMEAIRHLITTQQQYINIVPGIIEKSNEHHQRIVDALIKKDVSGAEAIMTEHIIFVMQAVEKEYKITNEASRSINK